MTYRAFFIAASLVVLPGCPGGPDIDLPSDSQDGTASTGSSSGSNITASTIDPSESLSGTQGATTGDGSDTVGVVDGSSSDSDAESTTAGGTTVADGTSSGTAESTEGSTDSGSTDGGSSSSDGGGSSSSDGGGSSSSDGSSSSSSDGGGSSSTGDCGMPTGIGNYDACLDAMNQADAALCGFGGATCINDGGDPAIVSVCSQGACVDDCDCPPGPGTGDAPVTCGEIAGDDMIPECFLDCSSGQTCPDDMGCFSGLICVHDGGAGGDEYGTCTGSAECPLEDTCIVADMDMFGVCSGQGCTDAMDCPAAPATGTAPVECANLTAPDMINDCYLDCSVGGTTCPDGMECFMGTLCMWPQP